jgi:polysaccharide pyruvyl transferase WcaK-like protein
MDRKKVNVLGWYNHGNIGDESYKLAFPLVLHENLQFIDKLSYPKDICILGGGDVLGGYFLEQISCAKRKVALSVSLSDNIKKETLDLFDLICVRDTKSANIAKEKGKSPLLYPDFAFSLTSHKQAGITLLDMLFSNSSIDNYKKKIGIVINSHLLPTSNTPARQATMFDEFCYELSQLADTTNASFVFIPFGKSMPTDDTISNGIIASRCKFWKKNLLIKDNLNVQQTLDVISACDLIISTRLHSTIFSCISGVPFIDITHNHKNTALLDDMSYPYSISYWDFNKKDLEKLINIVDTKQHEIQEKLQKITKENKLKLQELKSHVHLLQ